MKALTKRERLNNNQRRWCLQKKYGITPEQYQKMFERQSGVCAICGRPPKKRKLAVEHAHDSSKRVRGLCCWYCNHFLIGKNTLETIPKVFAYLKSKFDGRNL